MQDLFGNDIYQAKYIEPLEAVATMLHWQIKGEKYKIRDDWKNYYKWRRKVTQLIKEELKTRQLLNAQDKNDQARHS